MEIKWRLKVKNYYSKKKKTKKIVKEMTPTNSPEDESKKITKTASGYGMMKKEKKVKKVKDTK